MAAAIPEKAYPEQWDMDGLHEEVLRVLGRDLPVKDWAREEGIADAEIRERLYHEADRIAAEKAANYGPDFMRMVEKNLLLQVLDQMWKDHLLTLDHLRQGIGLRAYAQRDPLNEYQREAFNLFEGLLNGLRERITSLMSHIEFQASDPEDDLFQRSEQEMIESREDPAFARTHDGQGFAMSGTLTDDAGGSQAGPLLSRQAADHIDPNNPETWGKVARNAACPCQSGKKFKHCHGRLV